MSLRDLYRDNGADGCNERRLLTNDAVYVGVEWNPVYCVYGWAHVVGPSDPDLCMRCGTRKPAHESWHVHSLGRDV